jgi:hypothetical protein
MQRTAPRGRQPIDGAWIVALEVVAQFLEVEDATAQVGISPA